MTSVCTGPEFGVDAAGRLRLELVGDLPDLAKPAGVGNSLRRDPDAGLWVPQAVVQPLSFNSGARPVGWVTAPSSADEETLPVDLTNPSPARPAVVHLTLERFWRLTIPAGAGATLRMGWSLTTVASRADSRSVYNQGSTTGTWNEHLTEGAVFSIPAGGTVRLHMTTGVFGHGSGSVTTPSISYRYSGLIVVV